MKYTLFTILLLAGIAGKAQMKRDAPQSNVHLVCINCPDNVLDDSMSYNLSRSVLWHLENGDVLYNCDDLRDSISLFRHIVFLMQQNKELSDRLDRLEKTVDSLERDHTQLWGINKFNTRYGIDMYDSLTARIDSLERRPYLFMDYKSKPFPQLIAKCPDGSCELIIESYK